ncbi:hypothetical protein L914_16227 [Phytophthora nicotianae]|uniref:Uncharacterized protein n=2 Tax=Phytophthora nicotianae TaxID=4792 RepID=V9ED75_PHYNI|nr:hypothetical protein F443_16872 [Phytophthora nicotianae P1569]ETM37191.1 hypothetical protein L914_16227 [Phytophthora nicotianae]
MCRNFGIEQAIGWPAWQTGGLCLKFCDFFLVCLASARHFAAVLCRSWHCEYIWKVIFSRFFWVFVEAATIRLSSLEIQGGFEGGATLVVTCRPLSGSLEMTSEKSGTFENLLGSRTRTKARSALLFTRRGLQLKHGTTQAAGRR